MSVEIRRGSDRFGEKVTGGATGRGAGRVSRHAFSFGEHYDPERLAFGPMVCHDDHLLGRGVGFDEHEHARLDIVTWVVSGTLVHTGEDGVAVHLPASSCALLRTGAGTRHSEVAGDDGPCRFVQVWLRADGADGADGGAVSYAHTPVDAAPGRGLVPVVGDGAPLGAVAASGARFAVARLAPGEECVLPAAVRVHAFVATGALLRSSLAEPLAAGDAFALVDEPGHTVRAAVPTDLLVWTFDA